jgi:hypothetical protein
VSKVGPWPKDTRLKNIGALVLLNCQTGGLNPASLSADWKLMGWSEGFHAYGMAAFTRILGMDKEEADMICGNAYKAVRNKNYHLHCPM